MHKEGCACELHPRNKVLDEANHECGINCVHFSTTWRSEKDFQIKDMGENILFFHFEDECDLDRVIEHEPWTYDKHLVIFDKVVANVPISALAF